MRLSDSHCQTFMQSALKLGLIPRPPSLSSQEADRSRRSVRAGHRRNRSAQSRRTWRMLTLVGSRLWLLGNSGSEKRSGCCGRRRGGGVRECQRGNRSHVLPPISPPRARAVVRKRQDTRDSVSVMIGRGWSDRRRSLFDRLVEHAGTTRQRRIVPAGRRSTKRSEYGANVKPPEAVNAGISALPSSSTQSPRAYAARSKDNPRNSAPPA